MTERIADCENCGARGMIPLGSDTQFFACEICLPGAGSKLDRLIPLKCGGCNDKVIHSCAREQCFRGCDYTCLGCTKEFCAKCASESLMGICSGCHCTRKSCCDEKAGCRCYSGTGSSPPPRYCGTCAKNYRKDHPPRCTNSSGFSEDEARAIWQKNVDEWIKEHPDSTIKPVFEWPYKRV